MLSDLTIFLNTHHSAEDCWVMFFSQLKKHWPNHPPVIIACDRTIFWGQTCLNYSRITKFSNQYLAGLCFVETPYVLPLQEDFILYADVDEAAIERQAKAVFARGHDCLRLICSGYGYNYSMQASIWETSALKQLYAQADFATPWEAEIGLCEVYERDRCVMADCGGKRRGRDHFDSTIFPYFSTAIVRGKWNHEYRAELTPLLAEYGIDAKLRGWTE